MSEKYAIELKYPRNGQYPEQMYSFVKDIIFMEQLKTEGFDATFSMVLVDDKLFYEGKVAEAVSIVVEYQWRKGNIWNIL